MSHSTSGTDPVIDSGPGARSATGLMVASSAAEARAGDAVVAHHAELAGALALYVDRLGAAVRSGGTAEAAQVCDDLVGWCRAELVPHALAEEEILYPAAAARPEAALLISAMLAEHQVVLGLVEDLSYALDGVSAMATARALRAIFESHVAKENDLILPLLVAAPDVSVADLLEEMHEETHEHHAPGGDQDGEPASGCGGHACSCGETDPAGLPELDARAVPHAIRHATVFGALDSVAPGEGLVLVAPHDPLPLLGQIEARDPGAFTVDYLERGPEAWRLAIVRRSA